MQLPSIPSCDEKRNKHEHQALWQYSKIPQEKSVRKICFCFIMLSSISSCNAKIRQEGSELWGHLNRSLRNLPQIFMLSSLLSFLSSCMQRQQYKHQAQMQPSSLPMESFALIFAHPASSLGFDFARSKIHEHYEEIFGAPWCSPRHYCLIFSPRVAAS